MHTSFAIEPSGKVFLTRPCFPIPQCLQPKCLLSKILPRSTRIQERYQVTLSCQTDEVLINLALKSDEIQPLRQTESLGLKNGSSNHHSPGVFAGLGHFAETKAFRRISPPCFIQASLQQYRRRPFFCSAYRSFSYATRLGSIEC